MKILKFLKNLLKEEDKEEVTSEQEIELSKIEDSLKEKEKSLKEKETLLISEINSKINLFIKELKEKIEIVKEVEIESKEKNEKIKSVVYEGRKKYIEFLEKLMNNLTDTLDITEFSKKIKDINSSFSRFNETSHNSYERATILIGKEMGNIKESLKKFSNEILEIFNENKQIISDYNTLIAIKNTHKNIIKNEEEIKKSENKSEETIKKIESNKKEKTKLENKLEETKKSKEYLENLKIKEQIKLQEEDIKNQISELRQLIDFKALSNFFHIFEDKMSLIKAHKDNFSGEFNLDNGEKILKLLEDSNLNNKEISDKIEEIILNKNNLKEKEKSIREDKTIHIISEVNAVEEKIENLKKELEWINKTSEKAKLNNQENLKSIKEQAKSIKIIIKD